MAILSAIVKAVAGNEIRTAARYLISKGFKLPKDYKNTMKLFKIDVSSPIPRSQQIKEQLASISTIRLGKRSNITRAVDVTGDTAVNALRAIQAEGKRRISATQFRKSSEYAAPGRVEGGKVYGFDRTKKDVTKLFINPMWTNKDINDMLIRNAMNTTAAQEEAMRAETFRQNTIKGYVNGSAGQNIEALVTDKINQLDTWGLTKLGQDMGKGLLGPMRSIDDLYDNVQGTDADSVIGMMKYFGIKFDDLDYDTRVELVLLTNTPVGRTPDGQIDWSNLKAEYDRQR